MRARKVLIVEDDDDDALLLKRALEGVARLRNFALAVTHTVNGLDGLGMVGLGDLMGELPDVVVVDLNMPVLDGVRFLRNLRGEFALGGVHAAVLTTSLERVTHDAALQAGADKVFVKPDTYGEMAVIAEEILTAAVGGAIE